MVQIWYGWYFRGLAGTLIEILVLRITPYISYHYDKHLADDLQLIPYIDMPARIMYPFDRRACSE